MRHLETARRGHEGIAGMVEGGGRLLVLRTARIDVTDVLLDAVRRHLPGMPIDLICQERYCPYYERRQEVEKVIHVPDGMLADTGALDRADLGGDGYAAVIILYNNEYPIDYLSIDRCVMRYGAGVVLGMSRDSVLRVDEQLLRRKEAALERRRGFDDLLARLTADVTALLAEGSGL